MDGNLMGPEEESLVVSPEKNGQGFIDNQKAQLRLVAEQLGVGWEAGDPDVQSFLEQAALAGRRNE